MKSKTLTISGAGACSVSRIRSIDRLRRHRQLPRRPGFTLVELLAVLGIVGLLAGIGMTAMQHIGRATALGGGARQFADHITMARNYAVANSRYLYLVVATQDTTNAQENAYTTYGFCVADSPTNSLQAARSTTNVIYIEDLQRLPRGVVFDSGTTNNVPLKAVSFPTDGTNLVLTTAWVVTFTPNGQVLPLSRRPKFTLYEGVVDGSTLQPMRTGTSSNSYSIEINSLVGKPVITKTP
jgi:prepilin-type N-terminal cleavage/methylation domain-containing protein